MAHDYYKILGVTKNATDDDIKKAYRKLAHKYHPDKAQGDEKKFKEINEAYQILSNKERRAQYDRFGQTFNGTGGPGFGGQGPQGFGFDFGFEGGGMNPEDLSNLNDIFDSIFEGMGRGGGEKKNAAPINTVLI
jgi:DnaJ-class molecular chaperone